MKPNRISPCALIRACISLCLVIVTTSCTQTLPASTSPLDSPGTKGTAEIPVAPKPTVPFAHTMMIDLSVPHRVVSKADVLMNSDDRSDCIQFCRAPHGDASKTISRVYMAAGWNGYHQVSEDDRKLRNVLKEFHAAGIEVHNLQGYHGWAADGGMTSALDVIENLLRFNMEGAKNERFDGLILDVEPYVLGVYNEDTMHWKTDSPTIWKNYLHVLDRIRERIARYRSETGDAFPLGESIPDWYPVDPDDAGVSFRAVMDRMDYVWIMSYHDDWKVCSRAVRHELEYAKELGRHVVIGLCVISADQTGTFPDDQTFHEEGLGALENARTQLRNEFQDVSTFKELSIFIYDSYKDLRR